MTFLDDVHAIMRRLMRMLAISVDASQAAAFTLDPDSAVLDPLCTLYHIYNPNETPPQREIALKAFRQYVWTAIRADVHMAIPAGPPMFCLVALIRRDPRVCGAFAVAIRAADETDADRRLAMLVRLLNPPPAGNPASLLAVTHHLATKLANSVQAYESVLYRVDRTAEDGDGLTILTWVGRSGPARKEWAIDICEQAVRHALGVNRSGAYQIWGPLFCLVWLIEYNDHLCGALAAIVKPDKDADADVNRRLRKLTGPIAGVAADADLIVRLYRRPSAPPGRGPGESPGADGGASDAESGGEDSSD